MTLTPTNVSLFQQWQATPAKKPLTMCSRQDCINIVGVKSCMKIYGRKTTTKKSVTFANMAKVKYTLRLDEYSDMEKHATWYTSEELRHVREEARQTVKAIASTATSVMMVVAADTCISNNTDKVRHCTRGLEHRAPKLWARRKQLRAMARDAVLDEQDEQRIIGENDADRLCQIYQECTYQARCAAIIMGTSDYEQVAQDLQQYHYFAAFHHHHQQQQQQQELKKLPQQHKQLQPTSQLTSRSRCSSLGNLRPSRLRTL